MVDNRRCHVIKAKLTDTEYKRFLCLVEKSGAKNNAEFLRERILLSDRQIAKHEKMAEKYGKEQLEGQLSALSDMYCVINQYKAGIDKELAVEKLEKDVEKLCQLLK